MQNINWLNKNEYPFAPHVFSTTEGNMHYIDEGKGDIILFVHGTPEWSFSYRHIIKKLSLTNRCIAIDHLGFGLSDKLPHAEYTVEAHAGRLELFISALQLKNIILVAGDFGGAMALYYAIQHKENVKHIILWNTWMWDLMTDKHFSTPANFVHTWAGRFMYKRLNAPVNFIMPAAYGNRKKLTSEIHRHYKACLPDAESRIAVYAIAKQLKEAGKWWDARWDELDTLMHIPVTFIWGMKDKFIQPYILDKWKKKLPNALIIKSESAGHFVAEEEPELMSLHIENALKNISV